MLKCLMCFVVVGFSQMACAHKTTCGGIAGMRCEDGYVCKLEDASVMDGLGVCVPDGK